MGINILVLNTSEGVVFKFRDLIKAAESGLCLLDDGDAVVVVVGLSA